MSSKRQEPKYKINRRLQVNLWGRPKSPLNRREYGPGQHGQRRKKPSDFGTQLAAKQKLKGYYANIGERQFRRLYEEAVRRRGDTGDNLIELLERRLDAVVYRMKFVPTPFAARQLVNHRHVLVNGRRVNIPSYTVRDGDTIELTAKAKEMALVLEASRSGERDVPDYLEIDHDRMRGRFIRAPKPTDVPLSGVDGAQPRHRVSIRADAVGASPLHLKQPRSPRLFPLRDRPPASTLMTARPLSAGAISTGDCDADPAPLDRPLADPRERRFRDGRDRAGLGAKGAPAAARRGGQSRRPGGARTEGGSLAPALDRADRRHLDRRALRHFRRSDLGRPARSGSSRPIPGSSRDTPMSISMAVVVIGISYFSLILGELVPKRIALLHPERIAAALGPVHAGDRPGREHRSNGS